MENFEDNIEKEYHERFHDFEEMPNDALWSKIQERIAPDEERPVVFWWRNFRQMGIAASILLGLVLGGYYFSDISINKTTQKENSNATKSTPKSQTFKKRIPIENSGIDDNATGYGEEITQEKTSENFAQNEFKKVNKISEIEINNTKNDFEAVPEKRIFDENIIQKQADLTKNIEPINVETEQVLPQNHLEKQTNEVALNSEKKGENIEEKNLQSIAGRYAAAGVPHSQLLIEKELNQNIAFLVAKKANFPDIEKQLSLPALNPVEPVIAFEKTPKSHLVFIPPSEVFANVTPMLSYYAFSPNKGDNVLVNDFSSSPDRLSFAAQFGVVYPLTKKLDLRTGLSFYTGKSKISYDFTNNNLRSIKVIDETNIEISPTKSLITESRNWQYIEIQSDLLYQIKKLHAISLGFRAGVQTSALNKPVFSGKIGYRVSKPITRRVALWLEPSMSVSLSSQKSIENFFIYRTTGFGLNMGVSLLRNY